MSQLSRASQIMKYVRRRGGASFGDLYQLLEPISRTTLSSLLAELVRLGEIEHVGRLYRFAQSRFLADELKGFELPLSIRERTQAILQEAALASGHACALFARVGTTTMKIVDQYNLERPHWSFSPIGYEWPLVPFHGFAKVFLAYEKAQVVEVCYDRWASHLKTELIPESLDVFRNQLSDIRRQGYALEYQEELATLLRIAMPVSVASGTGPCFVVGFVARSIYLLELDKCLEVLQATAAELSSILEPDAVSKSV